MAFEKVVLLSGETRSAYIQRRLGEGADVNTITDEINSPALYSGTGKRWAPGVVYIEQRKLQPKAPKRDPLLSAVKTAPPELALLGGHEPGDSELADDEPETEEVPAEFEGKLTAEDMREIRAEAAEKLRKEERKIARAAALKKATEELALEARRAAQRGSPKGDLVDVYIDVAPYAVLGNDSSGIALDGERYEHGRTYRVTRPVAAVLNEIMQRTYQHQESISGQRQDWNRKRNIEVSAKRGVRGAEGLRA